MQTLDWPELIAILKTKATSEKARLLLQDLSPFASEAEALNQVDEIFHAHAITSHSQQRPFFESLDLFDPWHSRLKKGAVLKTLELKDVKHFCLELIALRSLLENHNNPITQIWYQQLFNAESSLSMIEQLITPNGDIRSDASEKLYRLFREKDQLAKQIQTTLDRLVKDFDMQEYLQDKFVTTREGRWVVPVKSGRQHAVTGVIHGSSQTKQTVYIEPDHVIPLNNRLREVEVEIEDEIERLLIETSRFLAQFHPSFLMAHELMLKLDQLFAMATFSAEIKASRFEFSHHTFRFDNICHPLMVIQKKDPVPNQVQLVAPKTILLLSGPNAGGKTVLMKSIGLACHMARCGLPICASFAQLPFFKNILVGIGDSQKVNEELSTFAAHIKLLNQASQLKGPDCLILIDEIASSTDPEEGSALAKAFIETFAKHQVFAVITSHLNQLKTGWESTPAVLPGSLEFDLTQGIPTYQFLPGVAGQSLALEIAKKFKVDSQILDRAYQLLSPESKKRLEALSQTEQIKQDLVALQTSLRKMRQEAEAQKQDYEEKIKQFEATKQKELHKVAQEGRRKVDDLLGELKVTEAFDRHRKSQEIKLQLPELVKVASPDAAKVRSLAQASPLTKEEFKTMTPPGTPVFVKSMHREGIVQSEPNARGEVLVFVDSMRLQVLWTELEKVGPSKNPTHQLLRQKGMGQSFISEDPQLDLRGFTSQNAIEKVELALDRAMQSRQGRLKLVHGVGTEALKKSLRQHLTRSPLVRKWTSARPEEGGEGVTWVEVDLDP